MKMEKYFLAGLAMVVVFSQISFAAQANEAKAVASIKEAFLSATNCGTGKNVFDQARFATRVLFMMDEVFYEYKKNPSYWAKAGVRVKMAKGIMNRQKIKLAGLILQTLHRPVEEREKAGWLYSVNVDDDIEPFCDSKLMTSIITQLVKSAGRSLTFIGTTPAELRGFVLADLRREVKEVRKQSAELRLFADSSSLKKHVREARATPQELGLTAEEFGKLFGK